MYTTYNATGKEVEKYRAAFVDDKVELIYKFKKPILVRGYIL